MVMNRRPRGFWPQQIRMALQAHNKEADMIYIYAWIGRHVALTPRELGTSPHQGRAYYVHTARGIADDMVQRGHLLRIARGRFRLP